MQQLILVLYTVYDCKLNRAEVLVGSLYAMKIRIYAKKIKSVL